MAEQLRNEQLREIDAKVAVAMDITCMWTWLARLGNGVTALPGIYDGPWDTRDEAQADFDRFRQMSGDVLGGGPQPWGFSPFTDPASDYEVLRHVRETWDADKRARFAKELARLCFAPLAWGYHENILPAFIDQYQPGTYARAALAALEQQGEVKP